VFRSEGKLFWADFVSKIGLQVSKCMREESRVIGQ